MKYDLTNEFERNKLNDEIRKEYGKKVCVKIHEIRTNEQNSYLHKCIALIAMYSGNRLEDQKKELINICYLMNDFDENGIIIKKKTSELSIVECSQFIEWIRNFASMELGVYIPSPDEYLQNKYAIDKEIESHKEYL